MDDGTKLILDKLATLTTSIEARLDRVDARLGTMDGRLHDISIQLATVDERARKTETRVEEIHSLSLEHLVKISRTVDRIEEKLIGDHARRLERLEVMVYDNMRVAVERLEGRLKAQGESGQ